MQDILSDDVKISRDILSNQIGYARLDSSCAPFPARSIVIREVATL